MNAERGEKGERGEQGEPGDYTNARGFRWFEVAVAAMGSILGGWGAGSWYLSGTLATMQEKQLSQQTQINADHASIVILQSDTAEQRSQIAVATANYSFIKDQLRDLNNKLDDALRGARK